jgi:uncharacterized protein
MKKITKVKFGLSERNIRELMAIFSKYPDIRLVHVFGSRAKGNFNSGSDIDLAIMNSGLQPKTIMRVLSDCADSSLPFKVDLVNFHEITNPEFIDHIRRVGMEFYEAENSEEN